METTQEIGLRVLVARRRLGLTQRDVADAAGLSVPVVARLERGQRLPALPILDRIAQIVGVPVTDLIADRVGVAS